ncbi:MAG: WecB/TagA/CpsF family glycosyltransferase, partial [Gemmobacter sp.]|nr:WecB/TagA/CpsF family glycosyltransferase [Gemmobacter sp.]
MRFSFACDVIEVNTPSRVVLLDRVAQHMAEGQGFALATINLDHLVKLATSDRFRAAYKAQDLIVADGNPIVWLSQLAGRPVELVPGSDLVLPLARLAAAQGVSVAIVGSTQDALAAAAIRMQADVPGLKIATCVAPRFGFDPDGAEADAIFATLRDSGAGLCFIALGAPKQEILAARGRVLAPHIGFASVGAGVDFLAGNQTRAPEWVRKLALEWL